MPIDADYYPNEPEDQSPPAEEQPVEPDSEDKEYEGENTALLPKSLLGDVKPGQTVTLTVVHIYEDEVEVEMGGGEVAAPTPMETAESGLDQMAG